VTVAAAKAMRRREVEEVFMAAIVRIGAHPVVGLPAACAAARVHPGMYGELSQRPTTAAARERTVAPWNS